MKENNANEVAIFSPIARRSQVEKKLVRLYQDKHKEMTAQAGANMPMETVLRCLICTNELAYAYCRTERTYRRLLEHHGVKARNITNKRA